ncbi:MAG: hypothetical protein ACTSWR_05235 [Candidatus Helarchaeota archaeon]
MDFGKKRIIYFSILLLMFITGTMLILNVPFNIKVTYYLATITDDGTNIIFNVIGPKVHENERKAVIIGHGGMASKEFMKSYAIKIACAGFVIVTFNFRGHGQSSGEFNFSLLVNEIKAIKQCLISRADIDIHNLTSNLFGKYFISKYHFII